LAVCLPAEQQTTHPESVQRGQDTYLLSNPQYQRYDFVSEGDTPAFFYLLDRGFCGMEDQSYGSWAGRFGSGGRTADASRDVYRNTTYDYNPNKANNQRETQYCLMRWINVIQSDFGARADWFVSPDFEGVNHMPNLTLEGDLDITAAPGERIKLHADATDPDGDHVSIKWWNYCEAGTYAFQTITSEGKTLPVPVDMKGANSDTVCSFLRKEDAALAYDQKAYELYGSDAKVNFPQLSLEEVKEKVSKLKEGSAKFTSDIHSRGRQGKQQTVSKTSKYVGVSFDKRKKKWRFAINHKNKQYQMGYFSSEEEAALAYDKKAIELYGETARLNLPNKK